MREFFVLGLALYSPDEVEMDLEVRVQMDS